MKKKKDLEHRKSKKSLTEGRFPVTLYHQQGVASVLPGFGSRLAVNTRRFFEQLRTYRLRLIVAQGSLVISLNQSDVLLAAAARIPALRSVQTPWRKNFISNY
jgi:hypothetical protein